MVIVEGYLDAMAAHQAGARNVVALAGTALTEKVEAKRQMASAEVGPRCQPKAGDFDASRIPIRELWRDLGGGEINRGNRAKAFWRDGDSPNMAFDFEKNVWHDKVSNEGGGTVKLAATVLGVWDSEAWRYLKEHYADGRSFPAPERALTPQRMSGPQQTELLAKIANTAILGMDSDEAGKAAGDRNVPALLRAGLNVRTLELEGKDPAEFLESHKAEEFEKRIRAATPLVEYLGSRAREQFLTAGDSPAAREQANRWMAAMSG